MNEFKEITKGDLKDIIKGLRKEASRYDSMLNDPLLNDISNRDRIANNSQLLEVIADVIEKVIK